MVLTSRIVTTCHGLTQMVKWLSQMDVVDHCQHQLWTLGGKWRDSTPGWENVQNFVTWFEIHQTSQDYSPPNKKQESVFTLVNISTYTCLATQRIRTHHTCDFDSLLFWQGANAPQVESSHSYNLGDHIVSIPTLRVLGLFQVSLAQVMPGDVFKYLCLNTTRLNKPDTTKTS